MDWRLITDHTPSPTYHTPITHSLQKKLHAPCHRSHTLPSRIPLACLSCDRKTSVQKACLYLKENMPWQTFSVSLRSSLQKAQGRGVHAHSPTTLSMHARLHPFLRAHTLPHYPQHARPPTPTLACTHPPLPPHARPPSPTLACDPLPP